MNDLSKVLRGSKVLHEPFVELVNRCTLKEYLLLFRHPFLVGQDLYQGDMREKTVRGYNPTFRFQESAAPDLSETEPSSMNRHTFFLKPLSARADSPVFSIGRTADNDIVIVDYTISKQHARICQRGSRYMLTDLGATNGTSINETRVVTNQEHTLAGKDSVAFGRLVFVFMRPIHLFVLTRVNSGLEQSINRQLVEVLRFVKRSALERIARKLSLPNSELSKADLARSILKECTPIEMLELLF